MAAPSISFVIPVKNDARQLRGCLDSIARNPYSRGRVEIIVVDNGSTDGSADAARNAGAIVLPVPTGRVAELRNAGARAARAPILAFVDADHEIDARWIAGALSALADDLTGAAGMPYSPPSDANWVQRRYDGLRSRPAERIELPWLGSGNLAVKRAAFMAVGGFDTSLEACEDVDLCQRLRAAGYHLVGDPDMRSVHLGDPASLRAVFLSELWRGRDNLRVTLRGPWTIRNLRSALVPLIDLAALGVAAGAFLSGRTAVGVAALVIVLAFAAVKAASIVRRDPAGSAAHAAQALAVALVYDAARALAPLMRVSHRIRRLGKQTHVRATSHS